MERACEANDADGCFGLATFLRRDHLNPENDGIELPENVEDATPFDKEAGLQAYDRACQLESAFACATYAQEMLEDRGVVFEELPVGDQATYLQYMKTSCLLGWDNACEVYLGQVSLVDANTWPSQIEDLYEDEIEIALMLCAQDDLPACHQAGEAKILRAIATDAGDEAAFSGVKMIYETCQKGYVESCDLCDRLGRDQCDPANWNESPAPSAN